MAEGIKSRLRSASRSDLEVSEDDSFNAQRDRREKTVQPRALLFGKVTSRDDDVEVNPMVSATDDDGCSGESTAELDETVVAPTTVNTDDELTAASSDAESATAQQQSRTMAEQTMVDDYLRRKEEPRRTQDGALAKIRKTISAEDPLTGSGEGDSSTSQAVQQRFVMDNYGVYVTFDVPRGHRLFETYVPIERSRIPAGATVNFIPGAVGPQQAVTQLASDVTQATSRKTTSDDPMTSPRDAKIQRLEEELQRVKDNLKQQPTLVVDGSGDASQPDSLRRVGFHSFTGENNVASEAGDRRRRGQRRRPATDTERSQSEYDTCFDTDADVRRAGSPDSLSSRGRRRRRRRSSSDSESTTSATALMEMMRTCMKETMATIVEELPRKTVGDGTTTAKTGPTADATRGTSTRPWGPTTSGDGTSCGARHASTTEATLPTTVAVNLPEVQPPSPESMDMGLTDVRSLAPTQITTAQANLPLTTISKFDGEYWPEFIEYFESVADANAWNQKEKLTYLLMSIEGKPRAYAKSEKGVPQTYDNVKKRLESRYGQHEPAFQVRQQLREARRYPNERLEDFADRLQEIAQRGSIDARDRNDLFYQAFLGAVKSTPKLQHFIEEEHNLRRDLTIGDLLALTRRYMDRNPTETVLGGKAAVNVCKPVTQRKGQLSHEDDGVQDDVAAEQARTEEERQERKLAKKKSVEDQLKYLDHELEWVKKVVKGAKLHYTNKPFNGKKDGGKWRKGKKDGNGGKPKDDSDDRAGVHSMQANVPDGNDSGMMESEE